jgi:hypothetical protein
MSDWQPIKTAPKDREILLTNGRTYVRIGNWAWRREVWSVDIVVAVDDPTHWLPLPPWRELSAGLLGDSEGPQR